MQVFLKVRIDVSAVKAGEKFDPESVKAAVQEAVHNALTRAQEMGFSHAMDGEISTIFDYAEVFDADMVDQF
jgi:hypothetical protein